MRDHARVADPAALIERGVSPREIDVLRLVQEHLSNAEIASRLYVSERTVESHVSSLLRKLHVVNRRELARVGSSLLGDGDGGPRTNLPSRSTSFVGRAEELEALDEATRQHALVTLVGPAGVGKTRLALEAASQLLHRYAGGTWFVDLADLDRPQLVSRAIAHVLDLVEQPGEALSVTVATALARRPPTLVILDNCDSVLDEAGDLATSVMALGGAASMLATSREVLGLVEEFVLPVPPLAEAASIELFVDRARRTAPTVVLTDADVDAVARICRQLDHLPLALELAAAQIRLLEPAELAKRLDDRFRLLARPGHQSSRHGSIAAALGWSYERLSEPAKRVFERLSVFAGSCTLEAAEAVTAGDGVRSDEVLGLVAELVDRSMLTRERGAGGTARYSMLESLRLYGRQRLKATGAVDRLRRAHAIYYLGLAQVAGANLFGPEESAWTGRLRAEEPNLRLALDWAREHDRAVALRFGVALCQYWNLTWQQREAVAYLRSLLEAEVAGGEPAGAADSLLREWALTAAALLSAYNREAEFTRASAEEAIARFASGGDERGVAYARLALGWAHAGSGSLDRAEDVVDDVLAAAQHLGDHVLAGLALECRGHVASWRGDYKGARRWHQLELATWTEVGSRRQQGAAYAHLAHAARSDADLDGALELAEKALDSLDDGPHANHLRTTLADVARLQGRDDEAARIYDQSVADFAAAGDRRCLASTYKNLAQLAMGRDAHDEALRLFFDSMKLRHLLGDPLGVAECLDGLAAVGLATRRTHDAVTLLAAAAGLRAAAGAQSLPEDRVRPEALLAAARASLLTEEFDRAWAAGAGLDADMAVERAHGMWPVPQAAPR